MLNESGTRARVGIQFLSLFVGALLALGANYIGMQIVNHNNQQAWRRANRYDYQRSMLDVRLSLYREMSAVVNSVGDIRALDAYHSSLVDMISPEAQAASSLSIGDVFQTNSQIYDTRVVLAELNSNALSTMQMCILYYGGDAQTAIGDILDFQGDWWEADDSLYQRALQTMYAELRLDAQALQESWEAR
jgi:hypothetical protein